MFDLVQAGKQTYYISCPSKIGIYRQNESDVYLIDSGNSKDAGKRALRVLNEQGWRLKGIINTHAHADHIGSNAYLVQQTGCSVFAKGLEAVFAANTFLEPTTLYGGFPCGDLRHKFLLAQPSAAKDITHPDFPSELEVVDLAGHSFDMLGIRTPDNVLFIGDSVISKTTIEKYKVAFLFDVATHIKTLEKVRQLKADLFVPSHADAVSDICELVDANLKAVYEIKAMILDKLTVPTAFEELLKYIFDTFELKLNFEQYALVGSTIRSYLSWLRDSSLVEVSFDDNMMRWNKA